MRAGLGARVRAGLGARVGAGVGLRLNGLTLLSRVCLRLLLISPNGKLLGLLNVGRGAFVVVNLG